jgi:hypothetical protein
MVEAIRDQWVIAVAVGVGGARRARLMIRKR